MLVIALIAMLTGLIFPAFDSLRGQADSVACASNLRQIGLAMIQKVQDNGNIYPLVEGDPSNPIYTPADGAQSLAETLKPYGVNERTFLCISDAKKNNIFGTKGSSYEWFSFIDGERAVSAKIYLSAGILTLPLWRFPIAADYELAHYRKRMNILFADGHVDSYTGPGVREDVNREVKKAGQ